MPQGRLGAGCGLELVVGIIVPLVTRLHASTGTSWFSVRREVTSTRVAATHNDKVVRCTSCQSTKPAMADELVAKRIVGGQITRTAVTRAAS
jgi:hypothetical protein